MKNILLIGFIVLIGCVSIKDINNGPKLYTELTKEQQKAYEENYEIQLLKNWFPYLERHHLMVYEPDNIPKGIFCRIRISYKKLKIDSISIPNIFTVNDNFIKNYKPIKFRNLKEFIINSNIKKGTNGYTSEIIELKQNKNIIIYKEFYYINNLKIKSLNYFTIENNKIYKLNFTSEYKYYEKYLPEALKILKSFRAKKT
ncbi:hypothetical protein [Polaribacter sp.]|uniref:hypothetical protein n=1 Tax=Polaribacter sp. TaxID=1920175 RepID=UPI003F6CB0DF